MRVAKTISPWANTLTAQVTANAARMSFFMCLCYEVTDQLVENWLLAALIVQGLLCVCGEPEWCLARLRARVKELNATLAESTLDSASKPGTGVAQYPNLALPNFIW
jgi:hypothetical protein